MGLTHKQLPPTNLTGSPAPESRWLYVAALHEASHLPAINVFGRPANRQLVLVRYTTQLQSDGFDHKRLVGHGPMWTDFVTCDSRQTASITGGNRGANWLGLNVVRLGIPRGTSLLAYNGAPIVWNMAKVGREYRLDFSIPPGGFATIPFGYDAASQLFTQPFDYALPAFNASSWLRAFRE